MHVFTSSTRSKGKRSLGAWSQPGLPSRAPRQLELHNGTPYQLKKYSILVIGTREMAQQLTILAFSCRGLGSVSSTLIRQLTAVVSNSSSRRADTFFWPPWVDTHAQTHTHQQDLVREMAQQVKAPDTKSKDLSFIPRTNMVEDLNQLL